MSVTVHTDGDGHISSFLVINCLEANKSPAELAVQRGWPSKLGPPPDWILGMSKEDLEATLLVWELNAAGDVI